MVLDLVSGAFQVEPNATYSFGFQESFVVPLMFHPCVEPGIFQAIEFVCSDFSSSGGVQHEIPCGEEDESEDAGHGQRDPPNGRVPRVARSDASRQHHPHRRRELGVVRRRFWRASFTSGDVHRTKPHRVCGSTFLPSFDPGLKGNRCSDRPIETFLSTGIVSKGKFIPWIPRILGQVPKERFPCASTATEEEREGDGRMECEVTCASKETNAVKERSRGGKR